MIASAMVFGAELMMSCAASKEEPAGNSVATAPRLIDWKERFERKSAKVVEFPHCNTECSAFSCLCKLQRLFPHQRLSQPPRVSIKDGMPTLNT
jgi:hypothetical protein